MLKLRTCEGCPLHNSSSAAAGPEATTTPAGGRRFPNRKAGDVFQGDPFRRAIRPGPIFGIQLSGKHECASLIKAVGPELFAIFTDQKGHLVSSLKPPIGYSLYAVRMGMMT